MPKRRHNVLVIGDLHLPAVHEGYLTHCLRVMKEYKCDRVISIGDIIDHHCISHHAKHPEYLATQEEYRKAHSKLQEWHKAFPKLVVTIGNHDDRVQRICSEAGVPRTYLRSFSDLYDTPGWDWRSEVLVDGVLYLHGHKGGGGGIAPALNQAKARMCSVVMGHYHSIAGINWATGPTTQVFGMNVGCGIDTKSLAFAYDEGSTRKPVLACGVVLEGRHPYIELMEN